MSLDNTITLNVDVDGDGAGSPVDEAWSNFDRLPNHSIYHSDDHTPVMRDEMHTYRTQPKPIASFFGVTKAALKFSMDVTVATPDGGTTRSPIIFQVSSSVPVGAADTDVLHVEERIVAAIRNRAMASKLFEKGEC